MIERYSPLDRAIYGAEDDEDMDMILDHLEAASREAPDAASERDAENPR